MVNLVTLDNMNLSFLPSPFTEIPFCITHETDVTLKGSDSVEQPSTVIVTV